MNATDLCMHELDPSTCSVCKYSDMPAVYIFGRSGSYHASADCEALAQEQAGVKKRGGVMSPVVVARPGTAALDGRTQCAVCS